MNAWLERSTGAGKEYIDKGVYMAIWAIWQFAMALAVAISCIALIIGKLHMIERAEQEAWTSRLKNQIHLIR